MKSMNPVDRLKFVTGLQLAATLLGGIIAIDVISAGDAGSIPNPSLFWTGATMSLLAIGCLGKFLYAIRRLPKAVCVRAEGQERSVTPWLSPEA